MDALAAVVTLLKPQTILSKMVRGGGRWGIRYPAFGQPSFALVTQGPCWLTAEKSKPTKLEAGDFVLFPATPGFTLASDLQVKPKQLQLPVEHVDEVIHGDVKVAASVSLLGGYFAFDPINASMLVDLLPPMLHIRSGDPASSNVAPLVELIKREATERRAGQALVLTRLIEIMLVEALRLAPTEPKSGGLLAGLRDSQLAVALRGIHMKVSHPWTLESLARQAGMSRSSFAERFARVIGTTPLNYLLQWRIAVAKNLLAHEQRTVAETALAVGYQSASAFSTAFSRETGSSPKEFLDGLQRVIEPPSLAADPSGLRSSCSTPRRSFADWPARGRREFWNCDGFERGRDPFDDRQRGRRPRAGMETGADMTVNALCRACADYIRCRVFSVALIRRTTRFRSHRLWRRWNRILRPRSGRKQ